MPHVQPTSIANALSTLELALRQLLSSCDLHAPHPRMMADLERDLHALTRWLADTLFASILFHLLERTDLEERVLEAKRAHAPNLHVHQTRLVTLTLLGGHLVEVPVRALRRRGTRRGPKRRARGPSLAHRRTPVLQVLGLVRRRSAALARDELVAGASLESFERARDQLGERGVRLSQSSFLGDLEAMGGLAQEAFEGWLAAPQGPGPLGELEVTGRRVVLGLDGGRLRERRAHRGRKKANGYRDFEAPWVEPRQLVLYVVDEQGREDRARGKLAWASLRSPDELFATLEQLGRALGLAGAAQVIVVADGQRWQWGRLRGALERSGVAPSRIVEVLDKSHAVGRLYEIAHLPNWPQPARVRWTLRARKMLRQGRLEDLEAMCLKLAVGRRAKRIKSLTGYFVEHRERMRYGAFEQAKVPLGSGAVESMIRQVVNHRLKGCGKFWKRENAERMLLLRSFYVTGRLDALWSFALERRVDWWMATIGQHSCASEPVAA